MRYCVNYALSVDARRQPKAHCLLYNIAGSSNGRIAVSETVHLGSNPSPAAMINSEVSTTSELSIIDSRDLDSKDGTCRATRQGCESGSQKFLSDGEKIICDRI